MFEQQDVSIEWLILADAAQVVGGKLYLLGGGWDVLSASGGFPLPQTVAIAAAFKVPWNQTNRRHQMQIEIADEDGQVMGTVNGEFEVGRPPGLPPGSDQRTQFGISLNLTFPRPGTYVISARMRDEVLTRVPFRIVAASPPPRT